MDVKQIQYFSLVSSTGSFNAAAKQLYISVPGLVKAMDRLENELGVQLFVRRRSGVTLTPAGQALARYAPRYIRKYEMIVSNVRKAAAQREMRAEVCMTWGMLSFFPRNFLSRFVLSNPDMSLSTHNYSLQELEEALYEQFGIAPQQSAPPEYPCLRICFPQPGEKGETGEDLLMLAPGGWPGLRFVSPQWAREQKPSGMGDTLYAAMLLESGLCRPEDLGAEGSQEGETQASFPHSGENHA